MEKVLEGEGKDEKSDEIKMEVKKQKKEMDQRLFEVNELLDSFLRSSSSCKL